MIVCMEGVDLSGKGTQTLLLMNHLAADLIKFPNRETATGKMIYQHLDREWRADFNRDATNSESRVSEESKRVDATVFQALHTVNRLEQAPRIRNYLGSQKWLVLDRYWPSGVVFGGVDGLNTDWLTRIHESLPQPDYFLLLDVDLEHVTRRFKRLVETGERTPDRYETDNRVADRIDRYRSLWASQPRSWRWQVVDARGAPDVVHLNVMRALFGGPS